MTSSEEWRSVPGWEGHYSVSTYGRVRSEARIVPRKTGDFRRPEIIMRASPNPISGHLNISLKRGGRRYCYHVHRLVMLAFVGPLPEGMETLHRDGDPSNNHLTNLRYGTRSENILDWSRSRSTCKRGHRYTAENLSLNERGHLRCRECLKINQRKSYWRRKELAS